MDAYRKVRLMIDLDLQLFAALRPVKRDQFVPFQVENLDLILRG